jgi:transcriptional regulator with XRE-family HTH domain
VIRPADLHADDTAARAALRELMVRLRQDAGLTQPDLASRLGITRSSVNDMERATSWAVRRVQAWCRALNHQLVLSVDGIAVPARPDLWAELYTVAAAPSDAGRDRLHLLATVHDLIRAREALGWTGEELARRAGVHGRAIRQWEDSPDGSMVSSVQRYARALGGALTLTVVPVLEHAAATS